MASETNIQLPRTMEDFSAILRELTVTTGDAMASLYSLEVATINANREHQSHQAPRYKEIRQALKRYWEEIMQFLSKCHSFGVDVESLARATRDSDAEALNDFLEDMISKSKRCIEKGEESLTYYVPFWDIYSGYEAEFVADLKKSNEDRDCSGSQPSHPESDAPESYQMLLPDIHGYNNVGDEHHKKFHFSYKLVHDNIEALYPNGFEAKDRFRASIEKMHHQHTSLISFMKTQHEICNQCIVRMKTPAQAAAITKHADNLTSKWKEYQTEINSCIAFLSKMCDAINVAAAASPPRNYWHQRQRAVSSCDSLGGEERADDEETSAFGRSNLHIPVVALAGGCVMCLVIVCLLGDASRRDYLVKNLGKITLTL
ncbi:hypothetical protein M408DRAFT_325908 [Serendipita vermifera MAFF 305830]|uniref:Uncharacterized protein n=1 Tax=Serendipita vermifera MAFF 305830 TaxID=933852 RepID=A0A0C3BCH7_SERVB|nr:hypothetical protein M408DRAFT_325908 [Serendipita vermifera MAFF 305830]